MSLHQTKRLLFAVDYFAEQLPSENDADGIVNSQELRALLADIRSTLLDHLRCDIIDDDSLQPQDRAAQHNRNVEIMETWRLYSSNVPASLAKDSST